MDRHLSGTLTDEDLAQYLVRIGYLGPTEPTLATLQSVVAAHLAAIPFENLDPLLGTPVEDLGAAALLDKMVRRRRGGYCFEQNSLLRYVLERLGFGVAALTARASARRATATDAVAAVKDDW